MRHQKASFIRLLLLSGLISFSYFTSSAWDSKEAADRVRQVYFVGFSGASPNLYQRCQLIDNRWLRFCREGYFAAEAASAEVEGQMCNPETYPTPSDLSREKFLAYGIRRGSLQQDSALERLCPQSKRKYFIDGFSMGMALNPQYQNDQVLRKCFQLSDPIDRRICLFGLGRALFFQSLSWAKPDAKYLRSRFEAIQDGYDFAESFAGNRSTMPSSPGRLGASLLLGLADKSFGLNQCMTSYNQHHYLCALRALSPEKYFLMR